MKKIIVAVILSLVLVASLAVCAVFMIDIKTPIERSFDAVVPEMELFEGFMSRGGTVSIDAEIGSDIIKDIKQPIKANAEFGVSSDGINIYGSAKSGDSFIDMGCYVTDEFESVYSESFYGKDHKVKYDGLKEQLEGSIFAPNSGSEYALSQGEYELYLKMVEEKAKETEGSYIEGLKNIFDTVMDSIECVEETENITVDGEEIEATKFSYKIDKQTLVVLADAMQKEYNENSDFRAFADSVYADYASESSSSATSDKTDFELFIDSVRKTGTEREASGEFKYYVSGKYCVALYFDCEIEQEYNTKLKFDIDLEFTTDPKKDPKMHLDMVVEKHVSRLIDITLDYEREEIKGGERTKLDCEFYVDPMGTAMKYKGKISLENKVEKGEFETEADLDLTMGTSFSSAGKYVDMKLECELDGTVDISSKSMIITIDHVEIDNSVGEDIKLTDSSLSLKIKVGGKPEYLPSGESVELLNLSAEEYKSFVEAETEKQKASLDAFEEATGIDLFAYAPQLTERGSLDIDDSAKSVSLDASAERFVVAKDKKLEIYNAHTLELEKSVTTEKTISDIAADGGKLYVAYSNNGTNVIDVYDIRTAEKIAEYTLKQTVGKDSHVSVIEAIGDKLLCSIDNRVNIDDIVLVDMTTGSEIFYNESMMNPTVAVNKEAGIFECHDTGRRPNATMIFINSQSGEIVYRNDKIITDASPTAYFDGEYFYVNNAYYRMDGSTTTLAKAGIPNREGFSKRALLYKTEDIILSIEYDPVHSASVVAIYCGEDCVTMIEPTVVSVMQVNDNTFLLIHAVNNETYVTTCSIRPGYGLNSELGS